MTSEIGIDVQTASHVALLDHAFAHVMSGEYYPNPECCNDAKREILRRMDSACTSRRQEIEPHVPDHQR